MLISSEAAIALKGFGSREGAKVRREVRSREGAKKENKARRDLGHTARSAPHINSLEIALTRGTFSLRASLYFFAPSRERLFFFLRAFAPSREPNHV